MTAVHSLGLTAWDVRQAVGEITRAVLDREVDPSVDVFDQGATSLAFLRIVAAVNERFDVTVDVGELEDASVESLSAIVAEQLSGQEPPSAKEQR